MVEYNLGPTQQAPHTAYAQSLVPAWIGNAQLEAIYESYGEKNRMYSYFIADLTCGEYLA